MYFCLSLGTGDINYHGNMGYSQLSHTIMLVQSLHVLNQQTKLVRLACLVLGVANNVKKVVLTYIL